MPAQLENSAVVYLGEGFAWKPNVPPCERSFRSRHAENSRVSLQHEHQTYLPKGAPEAILLVENSGVPLQHDNETYLLKLSIYNYMLHQIK